jgi:hypothetical protein
MEGETTLEEELVRKIERLDSRVRFVGIIDNDGELVKGGMRSGIDPLEPSKKDEAKLYLKWFLIQAMTEEWNAFLGEKILLYTRHHKVDMYGIPLRNSRILLVSASYQRGAPFLGDQLLEMVGQSHL